MLIKRKKKFLYLYFLAKNPAARRKGGALIKNVVKRLRNGLLWLQLYSAKNSVQLGGSCRIIHFSLRISMQGSWEASIPPIDPNYFLFYFGTIKVKFYRVGGTKEYRTGWYSHKGKNGVGLHRGDDDEYDVTCSDVNGERIDEQLGRDRVTSWKRYS